MSFKVAKRQTANGIFAWVQHYTTTFPLQLRRCHSMCNALFVCLGHCRVMSLCICVCVCLCALAKWYVCIVLQGKMWVYLCLFTFATLSVCVRFICASMPCICVRYVHCLDGSCLWFSVPIVRSKLSVVVCECASRCRAYGSVLSRFYIILALFAFDCVFRRWASSIRYGL